MFNRLGFDVFSIGHYTRPLTPINSSRGKIDFPVCEEASYLFEKYHDYDKLKGRLSNIQAGVQGPYIYRINPNLAKIFDVIVIGYYEENLTMNWDSIKDKRVVLRTISQMQSHFSPFRNKVKKVALSEQEKYLHGYLPDAVIRQSVDTNVYSGWNGSTDKVLTVNKWLKKRGDVSCWNIYDYVTKDFNRLVCGFGNEDIEFALSNLPQEDIQELRKNCGVYFSTCSKPGGVTYTFVEALSTGIPMVSIGPKLGNYMPDIPTFDAHNFIQNGVNGFWSDNPEQLKIFIKELLTNKDLASKIGQKGRETAIKHFSIEKCTSDWENFFKGIL